MDPFTEKELIDVLKAINLNLTETNVRLEAIENAIRESNFVDDSFEEEEDENIENREEDEESEERVEVEILDPQEKFSVDEEETETDEGFAGI